MAQYSINNAVSLQVVIGGTNVDFIAKGKTKELHVSLIHRHYCRPREEISFFVTSKKSCIFQFGQTNPGSVCQSFGGVGRNIAGVFSSDNEDAHCFQRFFQSDGLSLTSVVLSPSRRSESFRP